MRTLLLVVTLAVFGAVAPLAAAAQSEAGGDDRIGVGVTLGVVAIDQPLVAGGTYRLPSIGVVNTGSSPARFGLGVTHLADQREQAPPADWFRFQPSEFALDPEVVQEVSVRLRIPADAPTGAYFAHVEAFPLPAEGSIVGVAAATKLSFTVAPAGGIADRMARWAQANAGVLRTVALGALVLGLGFLVWRYLPVRIRLERRR